MTTATSAKVYLSQNPCLADISNFCFFMALIVEILNIILMRLSLKPFYIGIICSMMLRYDPYEVLMLTIVQGKGNGGVIGTIGVALSIGIYPKIVKDIATHKKAKNIQR